MLSIPLFIKHIKENVFPYATHKLDECADPAAVTIWKLAVTRMINDYQVPDEPTQELCELDLHPQDIDSKKNLSMPKLLYLAAREFELSILLANSKLLREIDLLR